jgi:hypothetical protein
LCGYLLDHSRAHRQAAPGTTPSLLFGDEVLAVHDVAATAVLLLLGALIASPGSSSFPSHLHLLSV